MGFKRFVKKMAMGGITPVGVVAGHMIDAIGKKNASGRDFSDCLKESFTETITEDAPGLSHLYQAGKKEGRIQGTVEQAHRDEKKIRQMKRDHERDRNEWRRIDKEKDELIDDLGRSL